MMTRTQKAIAEYLANQKMAEKAKNIVSRRASRRLDKSTEELAEQHDDFVEEQEHKRTKLKKLKLEPSPQPKAEAHEITFISEKKFMESLPKVSTASQQDKKRIYEYILESPRANVHYWNYTKGNKKDFTELVQNMTR